jgi:2-desacetyl-2-hydroxyethyl bacteriochlorophyllide A dehydrogenase
MKTLICEGPGKFSYADKTKPLHEEGRTLIKIERIGICGTDLHAYEGTQPYFEYPRVLGHELAGEIVLTDHNNYKTGEKVTFIPYFNCGDCVACCNGLPNCCVNMKVCGVHIDGGMVEYLSIPSSSLIHGQGLSVDELALIEPLAIGAHSIRRAGVRSGEFVLVIGAGPIGLGIMESARIAGANVIALDINENRLAFCKKNLNIQHIVNGAKENVMECLKEITNYNMPTVVIDATGSKKAINDGFQYMAHGARYVLVGLQKGEVAFSHPEFHKREGTLMSSRNATREDFEHVISCMKQGWIKPANYITHRVLFGEVKDQFNTWLQPESGVIKAMVQMD